MRKKKRSTWSGELLEREAGIRERHCGSFTWLGLRTRGTRGRKLFVEFVWTYSITSLRKWTHPFGGTPQTGQEKAVQLAKLRAENISRYSQNKDAFHYKTKGAGEFCWVGPRYVNSKQYSSLLTILFKLIQHFNSFTSRYPSQFPL